jgi:hypothetical protein
MEQKMMQHDRNEDTPLSNASKYGGNPETTSGGQIQEFMLREQPSREYGSRDYVAREYESRGYREYGPREYIEREYIPHDGPEFDGPRYSHLEKVTSLPRRRRSRRGLWAAVAIGALSFFILGSGIARMVMPMPTSVVTYSLQRPEHGFWHHEHEHDEDFSLNLSSYSGALEQQLSTTLHLTPDQIRSQLRQDRSLNDIAVSQGVSTAQLQNAELQGLQAMMDNAVQAGAIDQEDAERWMMHFRADPEKLDQMASSVLIGESIDD